MKNNGFTYLLFLLVVLSVAYFFSWKDHKAKAAHPSINELALEPDHMILNASHYLREHLSLTSTDYVAKAIKAMKLIEAEADSISNQAIERAIQDLEAVEAELYLNKVDQDHMNHAFVRALNSLALAQLRISEAYELNGEENNARHALIYAMHHLQNATHFSRGEEREFERHVFNGIDELLAYDKVVSDEKLIENLDHLIAELDTVVRR